MIHESQFMPFAKSTGQNEPFDKVSIYTKYSAISHMRNPLGSNLTNFKHLENVIQRKLKSNLWRQQQKEDISRYIFFFYQINNVYSLDILESRLH